jgi:hypothetical protein
VNKTSWDGGRIPRGFKVRKRVKKNKGASIKIEEGW